MDRAISQPAGILREGSEKPADSYARPAWMRADTPPPRYSLDGFLRKPQRSPSSHGKSSLTSSFTKGKTSIWMRNVRPARRPPRAPPAARAARRALAAPPDASRGGAPRLQVQLTLFTIPLQTLTIQPRPVGAQIDDGCSVILRGQCNAAMHLGDELARGA